ncbi:MAG: hypothetical protein JKY65_00985 [Planctomycetes bacterium]|nr:hypothetical protein [Planctomycetota bacterium]
MTQSKSNFVIAFLAGACVALVAALMVSNGDALPRAYGQAAGGGQLFAVTGTGTAQQGRDVLFVLDSASQHLAIYEYKEGNLKMGAVRNISYDLQIPNEYLPNGRKQNPPVSDIKKAIDRGGKPKKRR